MNNEKLVCICVPVYKEKLTPLEILSLKQLKDILGTYKIFYVGPEKLKRFYPDFDYIVFSSFFFSSISGYNRLLLHKEFYKEFNDFKYMLIYQLDSYVFSDQLKKWCCKNYDYIGAPWFLNFNDSHVKGKLWEVGNGGFSLRKIQSMISVLESSEKFNSLLKLIKKSKKGLKISFRSSLQKFFKEPNSLIELSNEYSEKTLYHPEYNEDIFWGIEVKKKLSSFNVPTPEVAMKFSFECDPRYLFKRNNYQLPFGCHAFSRYDVDFWSEKIPNLKKFI